MNKTVERAILALEYIAKSKQPVTMADVRNALGLPKSTASEILNTLIDMDILKIGNQDYATLSAGTRLYEISASFIGKNDLITVSSEAGVALAKETGKMVCMSLFNGDEIVPFEKIGGVEPMQPQLNTMPKFSLRESASGKAILAASRQDRLQWLLDKNSAPGDEDRGAGIFAELAQVAASGYAISHELPELCSIAAPVLQADGVPLVSLCIIDFTFRLDAAEQRRLGNKIEVAALGASRQMGYKGLRLYQEPRNFN
ncbi:helix-turn-helix domain-containing protein [Sodalis ligni]|jgi:DNA-binding IclR family transcriptional regulator|uniref:IclR family transcriptional regulator n=1 Tax=Sodalis ligni TaxID=2697027 RepID=A0A4R1NH27_9GAMM|nr:helix-turn-helix domain-containing protein [Sodalis ligni]QWA10279.1 helix-turn-helix domain-containing protein [Sodalis ligni]TCL06347.1 IclR family transcriptional regulator [Sodalis ligni]